MKLIREMSVIFLRIRESGSPINVKLLKEEQSLMAVETVELNNLEVVVIGSRQQLNGFVGDGDCVGKFVSLADELWRLLAAVGNDHRTGKPVEMS